GSDAGEVRTDLPAGTGVSVACETLHLSTAIHSLTANHVAGFDGVKRERLHFVRRGGFLGRTEVAGFGECRDQIVGRLSGRANRLQADLRHIGRKLLASEGLRECACATLAVDERRVQIDKRFFWLSAGEKLTGFRRSSGRVECRECNNRRSADEWLLLI